MPTPNIIEGSPPALPGSCYLCNSADREKFIDWETQIEFYGALYICDLCIIEAAQALGMLTTQQSEVFTYKTQLAEAKYDAAVAKLEAVKDFIDGLDSSDLDSTFSVGASNGSVLRPEGMEDREASVADGENRTLEPSNDEDLGELQPSELFKPEDINSL